MNSEESRALALEAAHELLLEAGPQAVTLQAVAKKVGRTHANLLHHFGSAAGLQDALGQHIAAIFSARVAAAVRARRAGVGTLRDTVDLLFDAADQFGGAALVAWMKLSGNDGGFATIMDMVRLITRELAYDGFSEQAMSDLAMVTLYLAIGDALIGAPLTAAQGQPRERGRVIAELVMHNLVLSAEGVPEDWARKLMPLGD